jgi:hypothetical protein
MGRAIRRWAVRLIAVGALAAAVSTGMGLQPRGAEAAYGDRTTCAVATITYNAAVISQRLSWMTPGDADDLYWERQVGFWEGVLEGAGRWPTIP